MPKFSFGDYKGTNRYSKDYVAGMAKYSLVLILNAISPHSMSIYGAYAQELVLRDFFAKESMDKASRKV